MQTPSISNKRLLLFYLALWLVWMALQAWALVWIGFDIKLAILDSVASNTILAVVGLGIRNILRYYRPGNKRFFYIFVWNFVIAAIWVGIVKWILGQLITGDIGYSAFLDKSLPVRFFIAFLITGLMAMASWATFSFEELRENEKRKADAEKLAKDAELFKLRHQLHPHFLFNSLNSISSLIGSKPEEARHMIQQLADFLRGTLKSDEQIKVTLEEELRYLQLYLDIEKVRFGHRLNTVIEKDEISLKNMVPQMILQPIVENAIKFGLYDTTDNVTIKINAKSINKELVIIIENPFDPATAPSRSGTGFGLTSIKRRLYLLFARNDLLETKSIGNTFSTTIKIPQHD
ncbi:MAG TPA: histidine kinase [Bacteroidia bacterium]|jgi:two-component system LytT family sensor kinase|nr:histidine kinase [Bacteroidia bacterium]